MGVMPWDSVADLIKDGIDKIWPSPEDKAKRDEAKARLITAQQAGDLAQMQAVFDNAAKQLDVNKTEAGSDQLFVAGWRPFVGWVCGTAFGYNYIISPIAVCAIRVWQPGFEIPELDFSEMMPVLLGMLGLGGMRSFEKHKGTIKRAPGG